MSLKEIIDNLPFGNKKTTTLRQLDKHGPGFGEIPVFVPADIEKSKKKAEGEKEKEKEK